MSLEFERFFDLDQAADISVQLDIGQAKLARFLLFRRFNRGVAFVEKFGMAVREALQKS